MVLALGPAHQFGTRLLSLRDEGSTSTGGGRMGHKGYGSGKERVVDDMGRSGEKKDLLE